MLQWLKIHHTALWGESVCGGAVVSGRLETLKWLHEEQQCEWSDLAGSMAARSNNLPVPKYIYHKREGGIALQHHHVTERHELSECAVLSHNPKILSWCEKKGLLVNSYGGHRGLYELSLDTDCKLVQRWLFKHGYRLPADHEEYNAMMERHRDDKHTEDTGAESDATAFSVYSSSEEEYDFSDNASDSEED